MKILSGLSLYIRYHFFEVVAEGGNTLRYRIWALKRLIRYLLAGGKECYYYLPWDLTIRNSIGRFIVPKNTDLVLTLSSKSEHNLIPYFILNDPSGIFLDIGANAGKYTVMLANRHPASSVLAFEPNPKTYQILKKNIELNNLNSKAKAFNFGLSEKPGSLSFIAESDLTGLSRIVGGEEATNPKRVNVPVESLDNVIQQNDVKISQIDLVKIDVEGHELEVLLGGTMTFSNLKTGARLLIEIHPQSINKEKILSFLATHDFNVIQLDPEYHLATKGR